MQQQNSFFAWECVSLVTEKRTLDFVVRDRNDLIIMLHGLQNLLFALNSQLG